MIPSSVCVEGEGVCYKLGEKSGRLLAWGCDGGEDLKWEEGGRK